MCFLKCHEKYIAYLRFLQLFHQTTANFGLKRPSTFVLECSANAIFNVGVKNHIRRQTQATCKVTHTIAKNAVFALLFSLLEKSFAVISSVHASPLICPHLHPCYVLSNTLIAGLLEQIDSDQM